MSFFIFYVVGIVCCDITQTSMFWEKINNGYKLSRNEILKYILLCLCSWIGLLYIYFNKNKLF